MTASQLIVYFKVKATASWFTLESCLETSRALRSNTGAIAAAAHQSLFPSALTPRFYVELFISVFFRNRKEMMSIGLFLSRPVFADLTLFFPWRVFGWNIFQHWKVFLLNEACRTCRLSESFPLMMPLPLSTQSFREEKQKKRTGFLHFNHVSIVMDVYEEKDNWK